MISLDLKLQRDTRQIGHDRFFLEIIAFPAVAALEVIRCYRVSSLDMTASKITTCYWSCQFSAVN